jgi:hypothetical protein
MRVRVPLTAVAVLICAVTAQAQSDPETAGIIATARNYIDGFAQGDSVRMRNALHADLAKRLITGKVESPQHQTADILTRMTGSRAGRGAQPGAQIAADSIKILDRYKDIAMVRIGADRWVDYLHMGKFGGEWKIINVAWQLR